MKRNAVFAVTVVLAAACLSGAWPGAAAAGRAGARTGSTMEAALGVRFLRPMPETMKTGETIDAIVMDPSKLAALGMPGLSRNERVKLTAAGPGRFTVGGPKGGPAPTFIIGDSGRVRLAAPAAGAVPGAPAGAPAAEAPAKR